ncbi:MAG: PepSY-associated TM helix domain-containing protein [Gammaproteobacteria bacterium]|nr:PepSY-associated TM helix domain-containing protein [Gammaproteobacteria bacterium]
MSAAVSNSAAAVDPARAKHKRRAWWLKQLHTWHWISAAVSLIGMLLFSATGITLNHAADIPTTPVVVRSQAVLPAPLLAELQVAAKRAVADGAAAAMPDAVTGWLAQSLDVRVSGHVVEWSVDEAYVSLPRPGGDAWINVDLVTGEVERETTDRGVISYLNDLHKGRHAGLAWSLFLDVFAVACLLFSLTGLWLLQLHSRGRRLTWPLVGFGLLVPVVVALLFIH